IPLSRSGRPVRILFDNDTVAPAVTVRAEGSFSVDVPAQHAPGEMLVTVEQQDGRRLTRQNARIDVSVYDRRGRTKR
ncbi:MAG TPA: hypothetical protein VIF83_02595, partial [Gemmatimonadaceae bacterium]